MWLAVFLARSLVLTTKPRKQLEFLFLTELSKNFRVFGSKLYTEVIYYSKVISDSIADKMNSSGIKIILFSPFVLGYWVMNICAATK